VVLLAVNAERDLKRRVPKRRRVVMFPRWEANANPRKRVLRRRNAK